MCLASYTEEMQQGYAYYATVTEEEINQDQTNSKPEVSARRILSTRRRTRDTLDEDDDP